MNFIYYSWLFALFLVPKFISAFPGLRANDINYRAHSYTEIIVNDISFINSDSYAIVQQQKKPYHSDHLLTWLQRTMALSDRTKLLAVCSFDAYFGNYNSCFGEAIIGGRVAAVYLQRLQLYVWYYRQQIANSSRIVFPKKPYTN